MQNRHANNFVVIEIYLPMAICWLPPGILKLFNAIQDQTLFYSLHGFSRYHFNSFCNSTYQKELIIAELHSIA